MRSGSPKAARTVVCVHGVSRTGRDFDVHAAALAERARGLWHPIFPVAAAVNGWLTPRTTTDRAYTGAMAALIARLDVEQVDWIGTSLGGRIGMLLASQHGSPVARRVLTDFGARVSAAALRRIGGYLSRTWKFGTLAKLEHHLRDALAPFGQLREAEWHDLASHSAVSDREGGFRFHYDPAIVARFAIPIWLDVVLWQLWDRIECPVLVLRGEDSDLLSADTVALMLKRGAAAEAGRVKTVELPGCGYTPALIGAGRIGVIRDFLFPSGTNGRRRDRARAVSTPEASSS